MRDGFFCSLKFFENRKVKNCLRGKYSLIVTFCTLCAVLQGLYASFGKFQSHNIYKIKGKVYVLKTVFTSDIECNYDINFVKNFKYVFAFFVSFNLVFVECGSDLVYYVVDF